MEVRLSSIVPSGLAFHILDDYEEALEREKIIKENLQNAFDDLSIDDDDDDDDDDSHLSDEEFSNSSHQNYFVNMEVGLSSIVPSGLAFHILDDYKEALKRKKIIKGTLQNAFDDLSTDDDDDDDSHSSDEESINSSHQKSKSYAEHSSVRASFEFEDLEEEYILQLLFKARSKELEQIKKEEIRAREAHDDEIKSLKLRLTITEGEKDRLTSALQESQKLIFEFRHENNVLNGKLAALELQYSTEKEAKENVKTRYIHVTNVFLKKTLIRIRNYVSTLQPTTLIWSLIGAGFSIFYLILL